MRNAAEVRTVYDGRLIYDGRLRGTVEVASATSTQQLGPLRLARTPRVGPGGAGRATER